MSTVHVYPLDDLIEHEIVGSDCVCGPKERPVEADDGSIGWIVVHSSLDGRELHEEDSRG